MARRPVRSVVPVVLNKFLGFGHLGVLGTASCVGARAFGSRVCNVSRQSLCITNSMQRVYFNGSISVFLVGIC